MLELPSRARVKPRRLTWSEAAPSPASVSLPGSQAGSSRSSDAVCGHSSAG